MKSPSQNKPPKSLRALRARNFSINAVRIEKDLFRVVLECRTSRLIHTSTGDFLVSGASTPETSLKNLPKGRLDRFWGRVCRLAAFPLGETNMPTLRSASRVSGISLGSLARLVGHYKAMGLLGLIPSISTGRPKKN